MDSITLQSQHKPCVFVIGNGFDIDLGWKTSYNDFFNSRIGKRCLKSKTALSRYIKIHNGDADWCDLEMYLMKYVKRESGSDASYNKGIPINADADMEFFQELNYALCDYLESAQREKINEDSVAYHVLQIILESKCFNDNVFDFNYTDLRNVDSGMTFVCQLPYYVHGCMKEGNTIIGVPADIEVIPGYEQMRKMFNQHYHQTPIVPALIEAKEIVIFGHSLSEIDYPYFRAFFKKLQSDEYIQKRSEIPYVTIFTYDLSSKLRILENLNRISDYQISKLFNYNHFDIICTKEGDFNSDQFWKFQLHLSEFSGENIPLHVINK